ncbi:hypothetical protein AV530_016033 [Patagioenas fasciata monilis]|uniref:Uncharacterized protein n=1 Tax=Patagioenas fasciata monilis TaxID=372326 RepID=A0A1V4KJS4_PATFA|nr:hypothetical protein AV530_016033 [Patagioenas fasciata monilis]
MKWASTSGERAALPTSEENFIVIQGVKILNGDKLRSWTSDKTISIYTAGQLLVTCSNTKCGNWNTCSVFLLDLSSSPGTALSSLDSAVTRQVVNLEHHQRQ